MNSANHPYCILPFPKTASFDIICLNVRIIIARFVLRRNEKEMHIAALAVQIHREKQLNRQMEMNAEVKRLRKELKTIKGSVRI